ncbi:hypothetical protein [Muribaculum intestinale]|uniref:hypothetical protein n=1 Tax=Muribaculum intestinale TaxID=1796646 RepID=UPI0025AA2E6E|nr:hypothetical protein [Muribaculum intestinale]
MGIFYWEFENNIRIVPELLPSARMRTGMAAFIRHFAVPLPSLPGGDSDAHASLVADGLTAIGL